MIKYYCILFILSFFLIGCITVKAPVIDGVNSQNKEYIKQKEQRMFEELDNLTK